MIPNGDVMEEIAKRTKKSLGLDPLDIELPPNNIVYAGAFKCFNVNIGILLRFTYDSEHMNLTFQVKANEKSAIQIIYNIVHSNFLL